MEDSAAFALKKPTTLVDSVEEYIYSYIIENNLHPGDNLPSEEEMAEQVQVSRNIVREALSRFKSYGYITSRRRGGIVIQNIDMNRDLGKVFIPQLMDEKTLTDALEMRILLEVGIIPSLFEHVTAEDIANLEEIVKVDDAGSRYWSKVEFEIAFHGRIFQITGNSTVTSLQNALQPVYRYVSGNEEEFAPFNKALDATGGRASHRDILEALKSGDPERYEKVIRRHLYAYGEYVRVTREKHSGQ